jgi:hypothetical protein
MNEKVLDLQPFPARSVEKQPIPSNHVMASPGTALAIYQADL